uniref:Integrase n=1 Tax=Panagrellus redivivus TaxID=6233 RepID=A0A7E4UZI2_PANRE
MMKAKDRKPAWEVQLIAKLFPVSKTMKFDGKQRYICKKTEQRLPRGTDNARESLGVHDYVKREASDKLMDVIDKLVAEDRNLDLKL